MKIKLYILTIIFLLQMVSGYVWACTVGYYTDGRTYDTTPATVITQAGYTPVYISDISSFDFNTIDVLMINVYLNNEPSQALIDRQAVLEIWVRAGGKMIIHDRSAGNAGSALLIGSPGSTLTRNTNTFVSLSLFGTGNNDLIRGDHGTITEGMLENSNGFVVSSSLPPQAVTYLISTENSSNVAAFMYQVGMGYIYYSGIPLDYYLMLTDTSQPGLDYRTIYTPNLLSMICKIAIQTEPESQVGDNCTTAQDLGDLTSPYAASTTGYLPDFYEKCGNFAPDRIFYIDVPDGYQIDIRQSSNTYDSHHSLRYSGDCPGEKELVCTNDSDTKQEFWINLTGISERVYWINGAYYRDGHGDFVLEWSLSRPEIKAVWTGNISTEWDNPGNWDFNNVPNSIVEVTIPGGLSQYPDLDDSFSINSKTGIYQCRRLNIQSGAQLTTRGTVINDGNILMHGGNWYHINNHDDSFKINNGSVLAITNGFLSCGDPTSNYQTDLIVYEGGLVNMFGGTLAIADELEIAYGGQLILNDGLIQVGTYTGNHPGSQDAKLDINDQATFTLDQGTIEIKGSYDINQPGLRFHEQANVIINTGQIVFSNASEFDTILYADLNGHTIPSVSVRLTDSTYQLIFTDDNNTIGQLSIDSGTLRLNGKTLSFNGNSPAITIGDGINDDDAFFFLDSGNLRINQNKPSLKALLIQSDGQFDIQSGLFERQLSMTDNYPQVLHIMNGGVFYQKGGTVSFDNQNAQYAWGLTIDSGGLFQMDNGLFKNDAQVYCNGIMNFQGGTFNLVSQTDEVNAVFEILPGGNIQAKNTIFTMFSQTNGLSGIKVHSGASIGQLTGDDSFDFDGCTFQNWHPQGLALTVENSEFFTIANPLFNNISGFSISKNTPGLIIVSGSQTGTRGGERFDGEPEGSTNNYVNWDNTVSIYGKDATGRALRPANDETNYYAANTLIAPTGEGINGPSLRWQVVPSGASTPETGKSSPALITLTKSGQISWYSGLPGKWSGLQSTEWSNPDNWDDHKVPTHITAVNIPENCPYYPVLNESLSIGNNSKSFQCISLSLEPGSMITTRASVHCYSIVKMDQATWLHTSNDINDFQVNAGGELVILSSEINIGYTDQAPMAGIVINSSGEITLQNSTLNIYQGLHVNPLGKMTLTSSTLSLGLGKQISEVLFKVDDTGHVIFQDSILNIKASGDADHPAILFKTLAQTEFLSTPTYFNPTSYASNVMYVDFGGQTLDSVYIQMLQISQTLKMITNNGKIGQLRIEKGTFDPNGQTLRILGNDTAIIVGDAISDEDARLMMSSGNIQIKVTSEKTCALQIREDGQFSISGGSFTRDISLNDSYEKVLWIESGGVFDQSGGTFTINNQYGDYHWGILIEKGALFKLRGGTFENDSRVSCYGFMDFDGGHFKISSGNDEAETAFDVFPDATICAKNTIFSRYGNESASQGINIQAGAFVGTLLGDDYDDFDGCLFQDWYTDGSAITFSNGESFTIAQAFFNNTGGINIMQKMDSDIYVTGDDNGTRGGEKYDSDPEGSQINNVKWSNTCKLSGKTATGLAVSPSDNETLYYASGASVQANGELLSGTVIHWVIIPEKAGLPSNGDGLTASFEINDTAEIVWYSGSPGQWTGAVSDQWTDPGNWSDHEVPDYSIDVLIAGNLNQYPVLDEPLYIYKNAGNLQCKSLKIEQPAILTSKSQVYVYSSVQIKGGSLLLETNAENAIQIGDGGSIKLLGGTLSIGRPNQDNQSDLIIDDGGTFQIEAGNVYIVDSLHIASNGQLEMDGGTISVGQYKGDLSRNSHPVFQVDTNGRLYMRGGKINIQSCCGDTSGVVFDPSATISCIGGEMIFQSFNAEQTQLTADFGGHAVSQVRVNMFSSNHRLMLTGHNAQFSQLFVNKGQFDLNAKKLEFDGPGPSITLGDLDGSDDASFLLADGGTVNVNQKIAGLKALLIQSDGHFLMSGGQFNRYVLLEDNFDAIIHVASGGLFQQTGGQVLIDNQSSESHWGVWIDSGGQFWIQGGTFYNDAKTRCYGNMKVMDSTYYVSSSCNETNAFFMLENAAQIQAKNAIFSRYCNSSISQGILIKPTATIGETTGDDTDDFDGCRFENWSSTGSAMTVQNSESFTITAPIFENTSGTNINKSSAGLISVTGQSTGTRGGEKNDSDPEGGMANYIDWENTSSLTGQSYSGKAVQPGDQKTLYFTSGTTVSAIGTGTPLSWEITPVNTVSISAGENSPAEFDLNGDATIIWYSIKPGLWRGFVSSDWFESRNWDDGKLPTETLDVTIPYTCTYSPVINQPAVCHNLTIEQNAQLTVQSMTLTVKGNLVSEEGCQLNSENGGMEIYGDWDNFSTFTSQTGTIVLSGYSNCQIIDYANELFTFQRLIIRKFNSSVLTFGNVRIDRELRLQKGQPHFTGILEYAPDAILTYAGDVDHIMGTELNGSPPPRNIHINSKSNVILSDDMEISGLLNISLGLLVIGNHDLRIPQNAVLTGNFSKNAMIITNGDGSLIQEISQPKTLFFPVGDVTGISDYSPFTLIFTSGQFNNAYVSLKTINEKFSENPSLSNYIDRYWIVTPYGITDYSCNVMANTSNSDIQGTKSSLYFGRWNGTNWLLLDAIHNTDPMFSGNVQALGTFTAGERDYFETRIILSGYLNHFCGVQAGGVSEEKTYAVSGENLFSDIVISPPEEFEISTTSGSGFVTYPDVLNLERQGISVPETQLYVRFKPTSASTDRVTAYITHSAEQAEMKKVIASGSGLFIRTITLSTPTPTTGIQVKIILEKENFDYSHVLDGGNDIRFFKDDQQLKYWIQKWNPQGESILWVRLENEGLTSFDMEYGSLDVEPVSNGFETFDLFDDFSGDTLDAQKWRTQNASTSLSNGILSISSGGSNGGMSSVDPFISTQEYSYAATYQGSILPGNSFILFGFSGSTDPWQPRTGIYAYKNLDRIGIQNGAISTSHESNKAIALYDENVPHLFAVALNKEYIFDENYMDFEGDSVPTAYAGISTYLSGGKAEVDWMFVRKFALPDITASLGSECNMPGGGIWMGQKNSDWSDPDNWNSSGVPKSSDNVIIPANSPNMPKLTATSSCKNIEIKRNASLNLGNYKLNVFAEWKNSGTLTTQTGAICFRGDTDIDASGLGPDTRILNSDAFTKKYSFFGYFYLGYKFKPTEDITIFSFRRFFGTRVSLWNSRGKLLSSIEVSEPDATWTEHALPEPIPLTANESYILAAYTGGKPYYLNSDISNEFTNGILQESRSSNGNVLPEQLSSVKWWMVDVIYKTGSGNGFENFYQLVIQKSGNHEVVLRSANIDNRLTMKSGKLTISDTLTYAPEAALEYATASNYTTAAEFPEINGPQNLILNSTGIVSLDYDRTINGRLTLVKGYLRLGSNTLSMGPDISVISSSNNTALIATDNTGSLRQYLTDSRKCEFPVGDITLTPEYSPLVIDITSAQMGENPYIEVIVENAAYVESTPIGIMNSLTRNWRIQTQGITDLNCQLTGLYNETDIPEGAIEKNFTAAFWNGTQWTDLSRVNIDNNTLDGQATDPLIISAFEFPIPNIPPRGTNNSFFLMENTAYAFTITDFGFNDEDPYDTFVAIRITQLPGAGQLTHQAAPVLNLQTIEVETFDQLVFSPSHDESGNNYAFIKFQVQDSDQAWSESSYTLTIHVINENKPPEISQGNDPIVVTISEDQLPISWNPPAIDAIDPDGDSLTWQLAVPPEHGKAFVYGIGAQPTALRYTPDLNFNGLDQWVVQVKDTAQMPLSDTIVIQVNVDPVNDPPLFECDPKNIFVLEDFATPIEISITPVTPPSNESDQIINYYLVPETNSIVNASINQTNGTVIIAHLPDKSGLVHLDIVATDQQTQNNLARQSIAITVLAVNDPPLFYLDQSSVELVEDFQQSFSVNVIPKIVPSDETSQAVQYYLSPAEIEFIDLSINPNTGQLIIKSVANGNGSQEIKIWADDGQSQNHLSFQALNINVQAVNDPPTFHLSRTHVRLIQDFQTIETIASILSPFPSDEISQMVAYSMTPSSVSFANVSIDPGTGNITISKVNDGIGSETFEVKAFDGQAQNDTASATFNLEIVPEMPPLDIRLSRNVITVPEDFAHAELIDITLETDNYYTDRSVAYNLSPSQINFAQVSINAETGDITITRVPDANGLETITVIATDLVDPNLSAMDTFTLNVLPVNDPPDFQLSETQILCQENDTNQYVITIIPKTPPEDESSQVVTYSISPNTSELLNLTMNQFQKNIVISPKLDKNGYQLLTIIAQEHASENEQVSHQISVTVVGVNTPPVFELSTQTVNLLEDFDDTFTVTVNPLDQPPDEIGQTASYSLSPSTLDFINMHIDKPTGDVHFESIIDQFGQAKVSVIAHEDHVVENADFIQIIDVKVHSVNDPPSFRVNKKVVQIPEDFSTNEIITITLDTPPFNELNQVITYSLFPENIDFAAIDINETNGAISIQSIKNKNGSETLTIIADDHSSNNNKSFNTIDLTVYPVNDPPDFVLSQTGMTLIEDFTQTESVQVIPLECASDELEQPVSYNMMPTEIDFADVSIDPASGEIHISKKPDKHGFQRFSIIANDLQSENNVASHYFDLTVVAVNDPPLFTLTQTSVSIKEGFGESIIIDSIPETIPEDERDQFVTYFLTPESVDFLTIEIDADTGRITIENTEQKNGNQVFMVTATDHQFHNSTVKVALSVSIRPANDPPKFHLSTPSVILSEDFEKSVTIAVMPDPVPPDEINQLVSYQIIPDHIDFAQIDFDPESGNMTINSLPDANGKQTFVIIADDHQAVSNNYQQNFVLEVEAVNDPPMMSLSKNELNLEEDFSGVADISCLPQTVPMDEISQSVVYRLSPAICDFANVQISSSTGRVTVQNKKDKNGSAWFEIIADDRQSENAIFSQRFLLNVSSVNDSPIFTLDSEEWILTEDFKGDVYIKPIPELVPLDEQNQIVRYSLEPQSSPFATVFLNALTGEITVRSRADENGSQIFKLLANDYQMDNQFHEKTFTLTIQAENDPPKFSLSRYSVIVDEDFTTTESILIIPGFAPADEVSQSTHYRLMPSSINFARVSINSNTGVIQIQSVENGSGTQLFTVIADDKQSHNNTSESQFSLTVEPINDPPKFELSSHELNLVEDFELVQTVYSTIETVPQDEKNQEIRFHIETDDPGIADVTIDRITGKLTITSIANANGSQIITVIADDSQRYQSTYEDTITINIQSINDPPNFSLDNNTLILNEDFSETQWISPIPGNIPTDEYNQTVTYYINSEDNNIVEAIIDPSTGKVQLTALEDRNGIQLFTVIADDGQESNALATSTFAVTIVAVNDPPLFTLNPQHLNLVEGFSTIERIEIIDELQPFDERNQNISYSLSSGTVQCVNVWFEPEQKLIFIEKIDDNQSGWSQITVTANDGQTLNSIATQTLSLTVTAINDPPTAYDAEFTTLEDQKLVGQLIAEDPDAEDVTFKIVRLPNKGVVNINAENGAFEYTPYANVFGEDNFVYIVEDSQVISDLATVSIHISQVNDIPVLSPIPDQNIMEGILPEALAITLMDNDGGSLEVLITSSNTELVPQTGFQINASSTLPYIAILPGAQPHTFYLKIFPQPGVAGKSQIQVKAIDSSGEETIQEFDITVEKYKVEAIYGKNGKCVPSGEIPVNTDSNITFGFYPDEGYEVDSVLIDGSPVDTAIFTGSYTFKNVLENHSLSVTFKRTVSIFVNFITTDAKEGYAPLTVSFISQVQGNVSRLLWDFGDGVTSNLTNPVHIYTQAGYHSVRLTGIGSEGEKAIEKVNYIHVKSRKIQGSVIAQNTGIGLSEYTVEVWQKDGTPLKSTLTDINGEYEILGLPKANDLVVSAWPPHGKTNYFPQFYRNKSTLQEADILSTDENDLSNIDFFLEHAANIGIQGCVLSESGNLNSGIAGMQVDIFSEAVLFGTGVFTNEDGCYSVSHLKPSDDYRVSVWSEVLGVDYYYAVPDPKHAGLYHPTYSVSRWQKATGVTPSDPAITKIDIILDTIANQRGIIRGTVYKSDGIPLPGVWISAESKYLNEQSSGLSDLNGHYTISELTPVTYALAPEKGYIVEIMNDNFPYQAYNKSNTREGATLVSTGRDDIHFYLSITRSLSGRITTQCDLAVANIKVAAWPKTGGQYREVFSNVSGFYTIDELQPSAEYIVAIFPKHAPVIYYPDKRLLKDAELLDLLSQNLKDIDFSLVPEPRLELIISIFQILSGMIDDKDCYPFDMNENGRVDLMDALIMVEAVYSR
ncbi:conserved hypothetical protein, secreted [Candidatus Magnetomorum sp. HK-1]|nr:conserved hypothetical protein, secreted [Candidatus Magnetomorum sp. HK-1]